MRFFLFRAHDFDGHKPRMYENDVDRERASKSQVDKQQILNDNFAAFWRVHQ